MGVPFGFSVGDIIAGIGVIKTSIDAFTSTRGATKDHKRLSDTLTRLSESLELIQGLEVDPIQDARQREVIRRAVNECRTCIEDFVCSIAKYQVIQPGLQPLVWKSRVKSAVKKLQWALCKKEDVAKFISAVGIQYENISVLLATLQLHQQRREAALQEADRSQNVNHREVLLETRDVLQQTYTLVSQRSTALETNQVEIVALLSALECGMSDEQLLILDRLIKEVTALSALLRLQAQIPPQVLLQQPVVFRDALDRVTPVHLDFIDSAEAFVAVLKVRFKDIGLRKLERNEFLLADEKDNRSLDLRRPWSRVMQPGQYVTMSMIFKKSFQQNICPGCSSVNEEHLGQDTTCINCGRTYRLVEEQPAPRNSRSWDPDREKITATGIANSSTSTPEVEQRQVSLHEMDIAEDVLYVHDEVADFRRVQLIGTLISLFPTAGENRESFSPSGFPREDIPYLQLTYNESALLKAIAEGDEGSVKLLLSTGKADPNLEDATGQTPLSWAAESGHEDIVQLLLNSGKVDPDSKDDFGRTPLSWAAGNSHEGIVKLLLNTGKADPNSKNTTGRIPLSWAAESGHEGIVKLLFNTGKADPNSKDTTGRTPLSWAAEYGHETIVELLFNSGKADPNSKDTTGRTPLSWAAEYGRETIVKLLLNTGQVDLNSISVYGETPLLKAIMSGNEGIVKLLLNSGKVDPDSRDITGQTPLSWAIEYGHETIVKLLLNSSKVDPDSKDSAGQTPLSSAAFYGHEGIIKLLLNTGEVEVNSISVYGETPLSKAIMSGNEAIAKLLVEAGALE